MTRRIDAWAIVAERPIALFLSVPTASSKELTA